MVTNPYSSEQVSNKQETILAIDPSINNLGWAVYHSGGTPNDLHGTYYDDYRQVYRNSWNYGLFNPDNSRLPTSLCRYFLDAISANSYRITKAVVEMPTFFNSQVGRIAAKQGHTSRLAWIDGYVAGYFHLEDGSYTEYTPTEWKGTMTKAMTRAKMIRDFNLSQTDRALNLKDDTIDAIMLLKYYLEQNPNLI